VSLLVETFATTSVMRQQVRAAFAAPHHVDPLIVYF
jgi:hypothetical protein